MPTKSSLLLDIAKIRKLRQDAGLTLFQSSARLGVEGAARWSDIESGRKANVTIEMLGRIAGALRIHPCKLLTTASHAKRRRRG